MNTISPLVKSGATLAPTAAPAAAAPKPPAPTPEQQVAADTAAGKAAADASGIGKEGSMGRLSDAHAGEANDLLAMQKARLGGMTPEEMQAAREQGTSTINRQLATNLQQLGDIAAGNGIRGGSAAGLQMQALSGAQDASGQLARQMILDNVAQKNIAMDRYGNTLQQQQGVGLGIQGANNDSANAETLARQLYGDNYASRIDAARSGIQANDYTQQGIDLTKAQIDFLQNPKKTDTPTTKADTEGNPSTATKDLSGNVTANPGAGRDITLPADSETTKQAKENFLNNVYGKKDGSASIYRNSAGDVLGSPNSVPSYNYAIERGWEPFNLTPEQQNDAGYQAALQQDEEKGIKRDKPNPSVVCTESYRQGLISGSEYRVTQAYGAMYLTAETHAAYLVWGMPVAEKMRHNARFARCIAWLVRYEIKAMRAKINGKSAPLIGKAVLAAFHGLNFLFGLRKRTAIIA